MSSQATDEHCKECSAFEGAFNDNSVAILPIRSKHANVCDTKKFKSNNPRDFNETVHHKKITPSKTSVLPFFIAEPEEIIFYDYTLGKTHQKQLKLRNGSSLPAIIDKLEIMYLERIKIKTNKNDWEKHPVAPGMCMVILVEFTPDYMVEVEGYITVKTRFGRSTKVKVAAYRKHPRLVSAANMKWLQSSCNSNVFDCGKCLLGSNVTFHKIIHNIGGDGQFVLVKDDFFWDKVNSEELFLEDNKLNKGPFIISPAYFSVKENSVIKFICEFSPPESGVHVENVIVASDTLSLQELTLVGEGLTYKPHFVYIKNSEKNFNITIEDDIDAVHYLDMGEMLPFTSKTKKIIVKNDCEIKFSYRWETREAIINTLNQPSYLDSSKSLWSVVPNAGKLSPNINEFSVKLSLKDSLFGKYRHVISLILEDIPEKCVKNEEVHRMKTTRGPSESKVHGLTNLLVAEVELWAECIPLKLEINPQLIVLPKLIVLDEPFTTEASIFNNNDIPVYCSWKINKILSEGEINPKNDIKWDAKITPFEACLIPHGKQRFTVTIQIKDVNTHVSGNLVSFTFICNTWYEACNSDVEIEFSFENRINHCRVAEGQSLKFYFSGRIEDSRVKIVDNLTLDKPLDVPFDFKGIQSGTEIKRKIYLKNLTNMKTVCQIGLLKNKENTILPVWRDSLNSDQIFSVSPNVMSINSRSMEKATLKFCPKADKPYCELLIARVDGVQPGPSWDFALTSGKGCAPSVVLYPSTTIDTPYRIPKAWAGTALTLPEEDFILKNESHHPSLFAKFCWSYPIGKNTSQLKVVICPKIGIIRPQETIHFSIKVFFNSKGIKDFILPCYIGKCKDPSLLFFETDIESPTLCCCLPEKDEDGFTIDDINAMGLIDKKMMTHDNTHTENTIWSLSFPDNIAINFNSVHSYKVESRQFYIENKSPFNLKFDVKLRNFAGKVNIQKFNKMISSTAEHQTRQTGEYFGSVNFPLAKTIITEVKPNEGMLKPWAKSFVEIWLIASTWGLYLEEIMVKFHEVTWQSKKMIPLPPPFTIICIANVISHPILFPALIDSKNKILRFGTVTGENQTRQRTICIKNTSSIDVVIVWRTHLRSKHHEDLPFQISYHSFNQKVFQIIKQNSRIIHTPSSGIKDDGKILNKIDMVLVKQMEVHSEDRSIEISMLPPIGPRNDKIFKVDPSVTIIPSHHKRNLSVTFNCSEYIQSCTKFHGALVGYVHIPSENSFSPGQFIRSQGTKMEQAMLSMEAFQTIPKLSLVHEEDDSTIKISVQKLFMENFESAMKLFSKKLILQNKSAGITDFQLYVDQPFKLFVKHDLEVKSKRLGQNSMECSIPPERTVEITIKYDLTRNVFDWALEFIKSFCNEGSKNLVEFVQFDLVTDYEKHITMNKNLSVRQKEHIMKVIPLQIVFLFPSVSLSTNVIHFGSVTINKTKKCEVTIKNNTDEMVKFTTAISQGSDVFTVTPRNCKIHGNKDYADSHERIYVTFKPKDIINYKGNVIITMIEGVKEICLEISGQGLRKRF